MDSTCPHCQGPIYVSWKEVQKDEHGEVLSTWTHNDPLYSIAPEPGSVVVVHCNNCHTQFFDPWLQVGG